MQGVAAGAVVDLMPAARAVGDDEVVRAGPADGGEQRQLRHGDARRRSCRRRSRRRPAMPQQLDSIGRTSRPGHAAEHRLDRAHGAEGLLVAMAVEMRGPAAGGRRAAASIRPAARSAARTSSKRNAAARQRLDLGRGQQRRELVAEGEEAGGLEPDDARAARRRRARGRRACGAPRAAPRRRAGRQEGAPAAERAAPGAGRRGAAGSRPPRARARAASRFSRLEVAVEGVAEEHEVAAVADARPPGAPPGRLAPRPPPARQAYARRAKPSQRSPRPGERRRSGRAGSAAARSRARERGVARQIARSAARCSGRPWRAW